MSAKCRLCRRQRPSKTLKQDDGTLIDVCESCHADAKQKKPKPSDR